MNKVYKTIRILTIAPIIALVTLSILYIYRFDIYQKSYFYLLSVVFLVILPILAYPIQPIIPKLKKGRDNQRKLAIIMAFIGYLLGIISVISFHASKQLLLIFMTYLLSGLFIILFNKILKIKASGHACGVSGPIALLITYLGPIGFIGTILLVLVYISSLKMKRHTWMQLIYGSIIPIMALLISRIII